MDPTRALFGAMFVSAITQSFVFAILPAVGRTLALSDVAIGSIGSLSALFYVVSAPLLGGLVRRFERFFFVKLGLIAGLGCNAVFGIAIALGLAGQLSAPAVFVILVLSRIALNVAWGGMFPAAQAYVASTTSPEQRIGGMAVLAAAFGTGAIAGPALVWVLAPLGVTAPFAGVVAITALSLVTVWLAPDDPQRRAEPATPAGGDPASRGPGARYWRRAGPYLTIAFLVLVCVALVQQLIAFQMQDRFGLTPAEGASYGGGLLTIIAIVALTAQWAIATKKLRLRPGRMVGLGGLIGAASMLALVTATRAGSLAVLSASFVGFGAAIGMLLPANVAALSLAVSAEDQGRTAGFLSSAQGMGRVVGPLAGTYLYGVGADLPFLLAAGSFLAVVLLVLAPPPAAP